MPVIILDSGGRRLFAKYYIDFPLKKQTELERDIFKRTKRVPSKIFFFCKQLLK